MKAWMGALVVAGVAVVGGGAYLLFGRKTEAQIAAQQRAAAQSRELNLNLSQQAAAAQANAAYQRQIANEQAQAQGSGSVNWTGVLQTGLKALPSVITAVGSIGGGDDGSGYYV
jgi:regulator of protease activity HflC (stomatin/prohibitin superfamily)